MGSDRHHVAYALLAAALVVGYGAFAWSETERRALAAAEAQAHALVGAVAAGIDAGLAGEAALEEALAGRLFDLATDVSMRLADRPGAEERTLEIFCRTHRLRGAFLLGPDLTVRAAATGRPPVPGVAGEAGPFDAARVARLEAAQLAVRARDAGLGTNERVVLGFGESPFGRRSEFLVGVHAPAVDGYVVLRLDTSEITRFEQDAGVRRVLDQAAAAPGITYLAVVDEAGAPLAVGGDVGAMPEDRAVPEVVSWRSSGASRVLDVVVPGTWEDAAGRRVRVGFDADPVERVIADGRRNVVVFTALVLGLGALGLGFLARRDRRQREREEKLRGELEVRERFAALGRLAGGVAHEVRSPLNALSMAAQRLPREAAPEDAARRRRFDLLVAALRDAVARVDRTVEDFLRMGRTPPPPRPRDLDIGELVADVIARECPGAAAEGPQTTVHADPEMLVRALGNVLRNAREAAPVETVEVTWRTVGHDVVVTVVDGGPGVPVEDRERVFEPFHSRRRGGTGLGLHLAREAVRQMGGDMAVDESPSGGARFALRLPGGGA